ncbi:carboxypeptidase regulatory-like domain-containing protein, partial [Candidatus Peregrinibacteria bacterium]|nr:carboxypeptidase regulatory-like domain-containing protein [Candidatus Peregrinibacteria bacterium]
IAATPDEVANNPATTIVTDSDRSNINITMGSGELSEVSIVFNNRAELAYSGIEAFINFDGFDPDTGQPTGFHNSKVISDISNSEGATIKIKDGNYNVFVHVPGFGEFVPLEGLFTSETTPGYVDIGVASADSNTITINLPSSDSLISVSGSVVDTVEDPVKNAWVWIGNPSTGYHSGVETNDEGNFTIAVPSVAGDGQVLQIGADKPGYMSLEPQTVNVTDADEDGEADTSYDLELKAQTLTINGTIYADDDGGTANAYEFGEELPNGWVFAQESENGYVSHAPVNGSGQYQLGVVAGEWTVYGSADGYSESQYSIEGQAATLTVAASNLEDKDINLSTRANWSKKTKKGSITPSMGGTVDDTDEDGTGGKVVLPANSLGDSNSSGSLNISNTTSVSRGSSATPFGSEGKVITATDGNGQPITNLNNYVDIELVIWKDEVEAELASERLESYSDLSSAKNGFFDATLNDWVSLETTRKAYYKETSEDTEWSIYSSDNADNTNYEDFIEDALIDQTFTDFEEYKLVFNAKTDHFTTFSVTTALSIASVDSGSGVAPRSAGSAAVIIAPEVIQEVEVDATVAVELSTTETIVTLNSTGNMQFTLGADAHSLTLSNVDVTGGSVTLLLQSDPLSVNLVEGETKLVDVDGDGIDDLEITLEEILSGNQVKLFVTSLSLPGSAEALANEPVEDLEESTTPAEVVETPVPELYTSAEYMPSKNSSRSLDSEMAAIAKYVSIKKVLPATNQEWYVIDFIAYGSTAKVRAISQRERFGLLKDFMAIYDRLPQNSKDWENMANIAAGTTPSRVLSREAAAIKEFVKVFKRAIDFSQDGDEAFVHQLAYNLRPQTRSLGAERSAIAKFLKVYKKDPNTSYTWAVMRAIAYSGVSEMIEEAKAVKEAEQVGSLAPQLPVTRNLVIEMDAVNQYVRLTGTTPSGDAWASVHFLAYGSTDESKAKTSTQRFEFLKNFRKKFNKLPTTNNGWSELAEMVR